MDSQGPDIPSTPQEISQTTQESVLPVAEEPQQDTPEKDSKIPKTAIYVLALIILLALGAFGYWFYQEKVTKKTVLPTVPRVSEFDLSSWKTYRFEKSYENDILKFQIKYPQEWQEAVEENENIEWKVKSSNQYSLNISWLNPDYVYDVESLCRSGMCNQVADLTTKDGKLTLAIWKPMPERLDTFSLPVNYLHATIINSDKLITPEFSTTSLSLEFFRTVLSTFEYLETKESDSLDTAESKSIDFSLCREEDGYQEYVGFGSTYLTIKKDLGNACEIEISNEVEGGYTIYSCKIPKSLGKMSIAISMYGSDFSTILQYCTEIKSGNVLMELQD